MVKLVCYNIGYCEGFRGKWSQYLKVWRVFFPPKGLDRKIVGAIRKLKPDILALVEVDTGSFRARKRNKVKVFKSGLDLGSFVAMVKYPLDGWLRLFHYIPILNKQANAIIGRYKFHDVKYHMLHEGTKRVVIESSVNCPQKVTLLLAHLALGSGARKKQVNELVTLVNSVMNPVILMGDFNTWTGEQELRDLMEQTDLKDKAGIGAVPTFPFWNPMRRVDYVLTSTRIRVKQYKVLEYPFSDHKPIFVEFTVK